MTIRPGEYLDKLLLII